MTTPYDKINSIESWLQASSNSSPTAEIETLRRHLQSFSEVSPKFQSQFLDRLHARAQSVIDALLPRLYNVRLPISHNTRQTVRAMQDALEVLIRVSLSLIEAPEYENIEGITTPPEIALWRIFHAIGRHIALADLTASAASPGIWFNLHRTYLASRRHRVDKSIPLGAQYDLQTLYSRILLLGALPASALSAQEWGYVHRLTLKLAIPIQLLDSLPETGLSTLLWVAPESDMPPTSLERKPAPDTSLVIYIQYQGLLDEIDRMLTALSSEDPPLKLLPEDVSPKTAQSTLTRLLDYLKSPKKRKFPRRRQGYRTRLCFGFKKVIQLFKEFNLDEMEFSEWMVVNESPGGYAAMHVAGRPQKVQVGDVIALRRDEEASWRICIVRWALSENPEHLELGLQEISPRARVGHMTSPGLSIADQHQHPTLFLPAVPPLRLLDAIAFDPAKRPAPKTKHTLVFDDDKSKHRDFLLAQSIEQSADVEVFLIANCR